MTWGLIDLKNRFEGRWKHMFAVNPEILGPPGAEIISARERENARDITRGAISRLRKVLEFRD